MKKILITSGLLFSLIFTATGCGKMKKAVNATARLAAQIENLQKEVERAYRDKLIDKETTLKITRVIRDQLIPGATAYVDFVEKLSKTYPTTSPEKPKASEWAIANALFQSVEKPFRDILVLVGALTPEQNAYISLIIAVLVELISTIRGAFSEAQTFIKGDEKWQTIIYRTS